MAEVRTGNCQPILHPDMEVTELNFTLEAGRKSFNHAVAKNRFGMSPQKMQPYHDEGQQNEHDQSDLLPARATALSTHRSSLLHKRPRLRLKQAEEGHKKKAREYVLKYLACNLPARKDL